MSYTQSYVSVTRTHLTCSGQTLDPSNLILNVCAIHGSIASHITEYFLCIGTLAFHDVGESRQVIERVVPQIIKLLKDSNSNVRVAGIEAIGTLAAYRT